MSYEVRIDAFEGPLDLLLHLLKEAKVNIYDIKIAEITQQYLDYIHAMEASPQSDAIGKILQLLEEVTA